MAPSTFLNLPHDILVGIVKQLKLIGENGQDLISCSLVNHDWYEAAMPIIYGNIALKQDNLNRFCEQFEASKFCAYVHSLTLSFEPYEELEPTTQLVPLFCQFSNLRCFSFWIGKGKGSSRYLSKISQMFLVRLIDALPISCTSLELDAFGSDAREEGEQPHLCDSLRKILPRMQHVRLRLRTCEALFAAPSMPGSLIRLPNIKTFIYNCCRPPGRPLPTCRCTTANPITHEHTDLLWPIVSTSLKEIVSRPNAVPKDAKIYAFMTTPGDDNDQSVWQAYIQADMQSRSSIALPYRAVWKVAMTNVSWVIRLPDDLDFIGSPASIEAIAEGNLWHELVGGARLPAAVLSDERAGRPSFAVGRVEKRPGFAQGPHQWKEGYPWKRTSHWYNEKLTGARLLCAEERMGEDDYLSLRPIREIAPYGWRMGDNDVLERIDDGDG